MRRIGLAFGLALLATSAFAQSVGPGGGGSGGGGGAPTGPAGGSLGGTYPNPTVVTNANLIGVITSVGNATSIASQTGTGTTFVMQASPTFTGTVTAPTLATFAVATGGTITVAATNVAGSNTQSGILSSHDYGGGVANNNILLQATATGAPNIRLEVLGSGAHIGFNIGGTSNSAVTAGPLNANLDGAVHIRDAAMQAGSNSTEEAIFTMNSTASSNRFDLVLPDSWPFTINKTISSSNNAIALFHTGDTAASFLLGMLGNMSFGPGGSSSRDVGIARNAAGVIEINSGTIGTLRDVKTRTLQNAVSTVSGLPTCNGGAEGSRSGVTDALTPTFLTTVVGGGAVHASVYCDGTNWKTD